MQPERITDHTQLNNIPDQLQDWIAALEASRKELKTLITDLPSAALFWQPLRVSHTIGSLLLHIAYIEKFWISQNLFDDEKAFLWEDTDTQPRVSLPQRPLTWYLDRIDSIRAANLRTITDIASLNHICTREDLQGRKDRYGLRWILWHLIEHEAHHRGQIALLKSWYQETYAPVY